MGIPKLQGKTAEDTKCGTVGNQLRCTRGEEVYQGAEKVYQGIFERKRCTRGRNRIFFIDFNLFYGVLSKNKPSYRRDMGS